MDTILYGANEDIRLSIHLKHITLIPIDTCNLNKILSLAIIIIISLILRPTFCRYVKIEWSKEWIIREVD